jgi:antitoxin (DNA-binding transcriptional repressor) of toxin-antitoxin stability system
MTRIDLDDLPPKLGAQLTAVAPGEEVLLVQNGVVVARLMGVEPAAPAGGPEPDVPPEERAKEIFELFRSSVEDEF